MGVFFVFLDQGAKWLWSQAVCNTGHAFGIEVVGGEWISLILLCGFLVFFWVSELKKNVIFFVSGVSVIFGGFSNSMDRIIFGCVRDGLPFFGLFSWNIADGLIVLGVCGMIGVLIFKGGFTR